MGLLELKQGNARRAQELFIETLKIAKSLGEAYRVSLVELDMEHIQNV